MDVVLAAMLGIIAVACGVIAWVCIRHDSLAMETNYPPETPEQRVQRLLDERARQRAFAAYPPRRQQH